MNKNRKILILSILAVIIVVIIAVSITSAFMRPIEQTDSITEISLSSCAKIKLTGSNSINLSNSYPMSKNKGLETTPYSFKVDSSCEELVGFNLYIATLSTNTIEESNIHYIVTLKGEKEILKEGILSNATLDTSSFSDSEKTELNTGLKGTFGKIYKIYNESIPLKGSKEFDLYLYLDGTSTINSAGKTFSAGVAIKSYSRDKEYLADVCSGGNSLSSCVKQLYSTQGAGNLYLHDSTLENGAGDGSYRYAGSSYTTSNFVCFGYDSQDGTCPRDNLYRIIGVFGNNVKLIKYDYANSDLLGTDGDYKGTVTPNSSYYKGTMTLINTYYWNYKTGNVSLNTWSTSLLNTTNLNTNFITKIGTTWSNKIATTTWQVGGNTSTNIKNATVANVYINEITSPSTDTPVSAKVGLMYVSDYGYAAAPSAWKTTLYNYDSSAVKTVNWMYMGNSEWTITPNTDNTTSMFYNTNSAYINESSTNASNAVRPTFYLEPSVTYVSGAGTKNQPIIIN